MNVSQVPFSAFPMLAKTDRTYADQNPILRKFYTYDVDLQSFAQVIADKSKDKTDRQTLVKVLKQQYSQLTIHNSQLTTENTEGVVLAKIEQLLDAKTFTVTTAHQPSLLLGPLYFVYKIFSTINLAERLSAAYPDHNFVPVFVIGGEDHDFEEVNSINIFGKKLTWEKPEGTSGSVGAMKTDALQSVLAELKPILGESEEARLVFEKIEKAYSKNEIYHDATQDLLNALFGKYGLVVLNMNDTTLKRLFVPIMRREIVEQISKKLVEPTQKKLESLGFKPQAFVRDINLFYMTDNSRERIVANADGVGFSVLNSDKKWTSASEILNELEMTPQYFSPNVVVRPLFQETILPNLAYIGGGGELAYWLERKAQFAALGLNFPMLIRRNSVIWLDKSSQERLTKLDAQLIDLVEVTDVLVKKYVAKQATDPLSMEVEKTALSDLFDTILKKAIAVDATLEKAVLAEKTKQLQSLEALEARTLKAEKQKHETALNQLKNLQQKFFPNGGLQERTDNFLPIYLKHGDVFFDILKENLNPLEQGMIVISE